MTAPSTRTKGTAGRRKKPGDPRDFNASLTARLRAELEVRARPYGGNKREALSRALCKAWGIPYDVAMGLIDDDDETEQEIAMSA